MNHEGDRRMRAIKTVTTHLPYQEWMELKTLARKSHVPISEYIRAICVDAIEEERELALQRRESKARATGREELQIGGGPAL